jgi:hypothetical protein
VIVPAAEQGRVDVLAIGSGTRAWGKFDRSSGVVTLHPTRSAGDIDLLDAAVRQTLAHGGDVHSVEFADVPNGAQAAAVLRW